MATVVEPADPRRAPPSNVLRQIHGNLPTETGTALVPQHTTASKVIGEELSGYLPHVDLVAQLVGGTIAGLLYRVLWAARAEPGRLKTRAMLAE